MKTINKRILLLIIISLIFFCFSSILMFSLFFNAQDYALKTVNKHLYENGILLNAGNIEDVNGKVLAYTKDGKRQYSDNAAVRSSLLHIIGDNKGFIAGGIQDTFKNELCGYSILYGVNKESENTLKLTLDSELCAYAYKALLNYKGCIAVCNYKTGEIICIATSPSYDMYNKPDNIDGNSAYEGVYINRLFGGLYTPGSTFKIVTAIAAIENIDDIFSRTFNCKGYYKSSTGANIICNDVHGKITFEQALNRSCNAAFAEIAIELGADKLNEAFTSAGLDASHTTTDRITTVSGSFKIDNTASDNDIGWAGIGQHTTLINPYAMLNLMCAIANGGTSYEPYFVKSAVNENERELYRAEAVDSGISINPTTASTLKKLLRSTVSDYYGDSRFGNIEMCGKTGTAEKDDKLSTAWFVGFSVEKDFPYAVVTVIEESGSGSQFAIPAASTVIKELYNKLK